MKKLLLFGLVFLPAICFSQKEKKPEMSKEKKEEMIKSIPLKEEKVFYDEIVNTDTSVKKQQLFIKIRQWFVENFTDSKNVLEVNDSENGLLTGKGTYKYTRVNGLNLHSGYTTFVMNVAIKDGKFRYQLYNFNAEGTNTSMWSNSYNNTAKEKVSMDEMANWYKEGKREKLAKKYLEDMVILVDFIENSLSELSKQKSSISDF